MKNDILEFLATREVIIVLIILGVIITVYIVLWFLEYMKKHEEKKKLQNNTLQLNKLVLESEKETSNGADEKLNNVVTSDIEIEKEEIVTSPKVNVLESVIEDKEFKEDNLDVKSVPEVIIDKDMGSSVEIQPVVVSVKEESPVTNDSIVLNNKFEEEVEVLEPNVITPVSAPKNEEEVIKYKDEVYTKTEAQQELERITEELRKLETEEQPNNIELTKYESEQEENAIISLDELIAKGKTITSQNEVREYQDDGNEPISIKELEEIYKNSKDNIETVDVDLVKEVDKPKLSIDEFLNTKTTSQAYQAKENTYHPSPIISPIYGIEEETVKKNITLELEDTSNFQKFDDEIRKTNEFLSKLKELQEKLD